MSLCVCHPQASWGSAEKMISVRFDVCLRGPPWAACCWPLVVPGCQGPLPWFGLFLALGLHRCWQTSEAALCLPAADSEGFISTGSSVVPQGGKEIEKEKLPLSFFFFFFFPAFPPPFWFLYTPTAVSVEIALAGAGCAPHAQRPQVWGEAAGSLWRWKFPLLFLVC